MKILRERIRYPMTSFLIERIIMISIRYNLILSYTILYYLILSYHRDTVQLQQISSQHNFCSMSTHSLPNSFRMISFKEYTSPSRYLHTSSGNQNQLDLQLLRPNNPDNITQNRVPNTHTCYRLLDQIFLTPRHTHLYYRVVLR